VRKSDLRLRSSLLPLAALMTACAGVPRPESLPSFPGRPEGFSAEYRISWIPEHGGARKARLAAAYSPPYRLRLEVLDPLGSSRAILITSEQGAVLLNPPRREFRTFAVRREALRTFSGMPLDSDLLAALLLGDPAASREMTCTPPAAGRAEDQECTGPDGDPAVRIRRGGEHWEIRCRGAGNFQLDLSQPPGKGYVPPRSIRLRSAGTGASVELEAREFRGGSGPEEIFSLQPPAFFREAPGENAGPWEWNLP
jgi:outer membrane biogenesis lipoprotein LolB